MDFSNVDHFHENGPQALDPAYQLLSQLKKIIDSEKELRAKYSNLQFRVEKIEKENSKLADENKTLKESVQKYEEQLQTGQMNSNTKNVFTSVSAKELNTDVRLNLTGDEESLYFPVADALTSNNSDSCKDAHGVGMGSIRNSLNLFNGSAVERTSVSTADSAASNYHKTTRTYNGIKHFDSLETNLNSSLVRTSASSIADVPSIARRFKQVFEKSPKKKAKTIEERYILKSFQEEKRHRCPHCDKSYSSKSNLNCHVRSHNVRGEGYECDVCWKVFGNKIHLTRHYRKHTGEKPYCCKICDKRFALLGDLKKHKLSRGHVEKCEKSTLELLKH